MKSDIEIATSATILPITQIAKKIGIEEKYLELYGTNKAKINLKIKNELREKQDGKLILVTAITPTPLGEGKTTSTIGLVDSLNKIGKKAIGALREPSLGPVFGIKGGACGGGYAQVNPMADINLHFTGDIHAVTSANNLISACIDNHLYWGNELNIDENRIIWKRCVDLNDRALRKINVGMSSEKETTRPDGYDISVASEIMAILCLSKDINDLRNRVDNILIAYSKTGKKIYVKDLKITGSVLVLLKDAIKPNLVQTLENNPILIHGGPFANIAHGCNSIIATTTALKLADYVVTEAGFGADLGAEKFLDIKTRIANLNVNCVVIVATIKALKYHGGVSSNYEIENVQALKDGFCNLEKHIDTIKKFNLPYIVSLNKYATDTKDEITMFDTLCKEKEIPYEISNVFLEGSKGGISLAKRVVEITAKNSQTNIKYLYNLDDDFETKVKKIAQGAYGAKDVAFSPEARDVIKNNLNDPKYKNYVVCMAKTPSSLSDNPKLVGRPQDFIVQIRDIKITEGARFIICLSGNIMTMPGLPKVPNAEKIDLDEDGNIINLS